MNASEQLQACWMDHMRRGEWEAAWRVSDRELRRRVARTRKAANELITRSPDLAQTPRHLQPIWDGTPLEGKRVLVRCYHGLGDTVQFIRFMPLLRAIARRTLVWAQPHLIPLLAKASGIDRLLPLHDGMPPADYDVDIEVMELPYALRATPRTLPNRVPYFDVVPAERQACAGYQHVGLVWQAGEWDPRRSIELELLEELLRVDGITWQTFQHGQARMQGPLPPGSKLQFKDILEEAAAMRALDLLISVDTLAAHLGGALAVPTWTLIPADADWRWMSGRDDTPWYPTMRLFRQPYPGAWQPVIARVTHVLKSAITVSAGPASRSLHRHLSGS